MRKVLITAIATCSFLGSLLGHDVSYDPNLTKLTFGGTDGTISVVLVGDEPTPDCMISANATPQSVSDSPLISIKPAGPNPAPSVVLNVHVLRQPQGESETISVIGSWASNGMPGPPCQRGQTGRISTMVTVIKTVPAISAVINGASVLPGIAPGAWMAIKVSNVTGTTRPWTKSDFSESNLPTKLESVGVTVNGKNAAVYAVSPAQLTALAPGDTTVGPADVAVTDAQGTTVRMATTFQSSAPALFTFSNASIPNGKSVLARHADGCWIAEKPDAAAPVYPVAPAAPDATVCSRPAAPGETIGLLGTGFGPLGSDATGNPLIAPTDRDFSDPYWPPDPKADPASSPAAMFPLMEPTTIQLWIGDEILPVLAASRTRPGVDVVWVTVPSDILAAADTVTSYEIKGSMLDEQINTVQIPVQMAATPPGN